MASTVAMVAVKASILQPQTPNHAQAQSQPQFRRFLWDPSVSSFDQFSHRLRLLFALPETTRMGISSDGGSLSTDGHLALLLFNASTTKTPTIRIQVAVLPNVQESDIKDQTHEETLSEGGSDDFDIVSDASSVKATLEDDSSSDCEGIESSVLLTNHKVKDALPETDPVFDDATSNVDSVEVVCEHMDLPLSSTDNGESDKAFSDSASEAAVSDLLDPVMDSLVDSVSRSMLLHSDPVFLDAQEYPVQEPAIHAHAEQADIPDISTESGDDISISESGSEGQHVSDDISGPSSDSKVQDPSEQADNSAAADLVEESHEIYSPEIAYCESEPTVDHKPPEITPPPVTFREAALSLSEEEVEFLSQSHVGSTSSTISSSHAEVEPDVSATAFCDELRPLLDQLLSKIEARKDLIPELLQRLPETLAGYNFGLTIENPDGTVRASTALNSTADMGSSEPSSSSSGTSASSSSPTHEELMAQHNAAHLQAHRDALMQHCYMPTGRMVPYRQDTGFPDFLLHLLMDALHHHLHHLPMDALHLPNLPMDARHLPNLRGDALHLLRLTKDSHSNLPMDVGHRILPGPVRHRRTVHRDTFLLNQVMVMVMVILSIIITTVITTSSIIWDTPEANAMIIDTSSASTMQNATAMQHPRMPLTNGHKLSATDVKRPTLRVHGTSAPIVQILIFAPTIHSLIFCDGCKIRGIVGPRYKCQQCADYDLCGQCHSAAGKHHFEHHSFSTFSNTMSRHVPIALPRPLEKAPESSSCGRRRAGRKEASSKNGNEAAGFVWRGVICDGCDADAFRGKRYRCDHEACSDYDLCETCFAKGTEVHEHDCFVELESFEQMHRHVSCDCCGRSSIVGARYKCMDCPDFDLCQGCMQMPGIKESHTPGHWFNRYDAGKKFSRRVYLADADEMDETKDVMVNSVTSDKGKEPAEPVVEEVFVLEEKTAFSESRALSGSSSSLSLSGSSSSTPPSYAKAAAKGAANDSVSPTCMPGSFPVVMPAQEKVAMDEAAPPLLESGTASNDYAQQQVALFEMGFERCSLNFEMLTKNGGDLVKTTEELIAMGNRGRLEYFDGYEYEENSWRFP
ncbi:hypothetical protein CcCBS67573_g06653 [Chytriomyces confervae]|uniref:ZZ-type domain-containing protein n=1 Tax=Chytriomyces confervae TaxID=246404 RepID=A0A507F3N2_9FUNG|nr:hypothetical protein CcCBS67573_g06653 [Chytriomyces confervae]